MLDEAAAIIRSMLSQPRTDFSGHYFSVHQVSNLPVPQQPELPLWIGGLGEQKTLKIVRNMPLAGMLLMSVQRILVDSTAF